MVSTPEYPAVGVYWKTLEKVVMTPWAGVATSITWKLSPSGS